jgi:hypothetical protein
MPARTPVLPGEPVKELRGRGGWVAAGLVAALVAGVVATWWAGVFSPAASSAAAQGAPLATQPVVRQELTATTPVNATLGYGGSYVVRGLGGGTLTWLPSPGEVIRQGEPLYETGNGSPVPLLFGSVPDWRVLDEGLSGQDVSQLNHDLVTLGYASSAGIAAAGWDYYSQESAYGVQRMEEHLGVSNPPGSLSVGQVVFEPDALRVSQVTGSLGGPATGPVLTATSDRLVVTAAVSTALQPQVVMGDAVTVTLPDGASVPGTISSVGLVASGTAGNATIPVTVTLARPSAAGSPDAVPVTVNITTAASSGPVLAVPVTALVARSADGDGKTGGGYDVEVAGSGSTRRWVAVTPGIYDGANGLVQVNGALSPGQRVVVAAT